jgi:hypothetical protein
MKTIHASSLQREYNHNRGIHMEIGTIISKFQYYHIKSHFNPALLVDLAIRTMNNLI